MKNHSKVTPTKHRNPLNLHGKIPIIIRLYRLTCWLLAAVCMIYLSLTLADYLQADPIGYLPSIGQWLIALFLTIMLFVTRKGLQQLFNLIWLTGLAGLVAIF